MCNAFLFVFGLRFMLHGTYLVFLLCLRNLKNSRHLRDGGCLTPNLFYSNFCEDIFVLSSNFLYTTSSKAVTMFEDDKRFKAVDLEVDREDLFRNYLVDLQKKVQKRFDISFEC